MKFHQARAIACSRLHVVVLPLVRWCSLPAHELGDDSVLYCPAGLTLMQRPQLERCCNVHWQVLPPLAVLQAGSLIVAAPCLDALQFRFPGCMERRLTRQPSERSVLLAIAIWRLYFSSAEAAPKGSNVRSKCAVLVFDRYVCRIDFLCGILHRYSTSM